METEWEWLYHVIIWKIRRRIQMEQKTILWRLSLKSFKISFWFIILLDTFKLIVNVSRSRVLRHFAHILSISMCFIQGCLWMWIWILYVTILNVINTYWMSQTRLAHTENQKIDNYSTYYSIWKHYNWSSQNDVDNVILFLLDIMFSVAIFYIVKWTTCYVNITLIYRMCLWLNAEEPNASV